MYGKCRTDWHWFHYDIYLNDSWPAVSQICSFIFSPPTFIILAPKSTPIVRSWTALNRLLVKRKIEIKFKIKLIRGTQKITNLSTNCKSKQLFPTPVSPMTTIAILRMGSLDDMVFYWTDGGDGRQDCASRLKLCTVLLLSLLKFVQLNALKISRYPICFMQK